MVGFDDMDPHWFGDVAFVVKMKIVVAFEDIDSH